MSLRILGAIFLLLAAFTWRCRDAGFWTMTFSLLALACFIGADR